MTACGCADSLYRPKVVHYVHLLAGVEEGLGKIILESLYSRAYRARGQFLGKPRIMKL
jgi:hypothetical protein